MIKIKILITIFLISNFLYGSTVIDHISSLRSKLNKFDKQLSTYHHVSITPECGVRIVEAGAFITLDNRYDEIILNLEEVRDLRRYLNKLFEPYYENNNNQN